MSSEFREGEMQALRVIDIPQPRLGLELPADLSFEQWEAEGRRLSKANHALQWYIGDWWNAGEKFGDERRADTAKRFFGIEHGHVMNIGWVARKFDVSCRHENLTFTHHQEAAALDEHEAFKVLAKAEQENWSAKDVRYVVQKLKVSNDQDPVGTDEGEVDRPSKPLPPQSTRSALISAYEIVIEFADALGQLRSLTRRESDLLAVAEAFVREARDGADTEKAPDNFDIIFIEKGRLACESIFKVSRLTVNHWLIQRGKSRLIKARSDFVRFQREQERYRGEQEARSSVPIDKALYPLAREAASYLQISRYGGWAITERDGQWLVGSVLKTSDELIAMAERQGFDSETARKEIDAE
jgi:hypothetical protein